VITATQNVRFALTEPISKCFAGRMVTGLLGEIRIQILPPALRSGSWPGGLASIWRYVIPATFLGPAVQTDQRHVVLPRVRHRHMGLLLFAEFDASWTQHVQGLLIHSCWSGLQILGDAVGAATWCSSGGQLLLCPEAPPFETPRPDPKHPRRW